MTLNAMSQWKTLRSGAWALVVALAACGGDDASTSQPPARSLYGPSIRRIVLEVDYARGAEPYTGRIVGFGDTWRVFGSNEERLFRGANKVFEVPTRLAQMEALSDVTGADFTRDQILAIARAHRTRPSAGDTASFYAVWLPGYYHDGARRRADVLGVSLGTTGVIGVFKPVIAATATMIRRANAAHFVEQATLVHEFGHAVGLVNNGLPMTTAHVDTAHGAHCTNPACTMYYSNEGAADAAQYASRYVLTGETILYGAECLSDAAAQVAAGD